MTATTKLMAAGGEDGSWGILAPSPYAFGYTGTTNSRTHLVDLNGDTYTALCGIGLAGGGWTEETSIVNFDRKGCATCLRVLRERVPR